MKKILLYLLACFFSCAGFQSFAQKELPPKGEKPKDFKLPQKENITLPNGFHATLLPYGNVPKVSVMLVIKTGNVHENEQQVWLSDLTANMLNQGTSKLNFSALARKVATMGGNLAVSVSPDQTRVSGTVLSEFAADFIHLMADLVQNPAFPPGEMDRLKADLKRELILETSIPQNIAESLFARAIFKNTCYGRLKKKKKMIEGYNLEMVKKFYKDNFGAARSVLYIAGVFEKNKVDPAIKDAFSKWNAGPAINYPKLTLTARADTIIENRKGAPQTTIILGLPAISPNSNDYLPLTLTNSLLGGSFGSRITSNIREDKGYTYSPYSEVVNSKGGTLWKEVADVTSANTIDALKEIGKEITKLQNTPPTNAELEGIKNYEAGIFVLKNSLPNAIIEQYNFLDMYGLPDSYLRNMITNIYKISSAQVSAITRKYINPANMTLVMVGDKESIEQQIQKK